MRRWSTLILALLNLALVILLWVPKQVDASLIPNIAALEGRTFKAETSGERKRFPKSARSSPTWRYGTA